MSQCVPYIFTANLTVCVSLMLKNRLPSTGLPAPTHVRLTARRQGLCQAAPYSYHICTVLPIWRS